MSDHAPAGGQAAGPRWRPISAIDRRVLGVLVEKAKTTPDAYPMSGNALCSGANQKNNRYPLMELEIEDIEESLERLRGLGAVTEVQGGGRTARFRHHMYEWLGAEKVELAVMAELLLRGAQTEGELRGRAARMEPISDLAALRPVLDSLARKGLIVSLSPPGRGHVLTHALYEPREMEKLKAEHRDSPAAWSDAPAAPAPPPAAPRSVAPAAVPSAAPPASAASPAAQSSTAQSPTAQSPASPSPLIGIIGELREEVTVLRDEVDRLRREMDDLLAQLR